jgi:hypothetical protein
MSESDGGPAFPTGRHNMNDGMTLRDYFAGQVLAGALQARIQRGDSHFNGVARDVWALADAMLAARDAS